MLLNWHLNLPVFLFLITPTGAEATQMDGPSTSTSNRNPYNRTWRICLDPLDDSNDPSKGPKPTSINFTGSESSRRRRCTEEFFQAWALLQKAVLYVIPESPDQLVPGTRVCAIWSASLGKAYFPGRIIDCEYYCYLGQISNINNSGQRSYLDSRCSCTVRQCA